MLRTMLMKSIAALRSRATPAIAVLCAMLGYLSPVNAEAVPEPVAIDSLESLLYAQQPSELPHDEIYRVELVVFAQSGFDSSGQHAVAGGERVTPMAGELDYGQPQVLLYRPADIEQLRPLFQQRQSILADYDAQRTAETLPATEAVATGLEPATDDQNDDEAAELDAPIPLPPLMLSAAATPAFTAQARQLRRAGGYRVLFQGSWYQHLLSRKAAPWVPISGGPQSGRHHELEGSIRLSRDRYLHITTDLWRNNFQGAPTQYLDDPSRSALLSLGEQTGSRPAPLTLPTPPDASLALLDIIERWYQQTQQQLGGDDVDALDDNGQAWRAGDDDASTVPDGNDLETRPGEGMQVAAAAQLQQYRRMRSGELHYLDHPLLGVIVRLTPWEELEKP